jgi:hypothetical protein
MSQPPTPPPAREPRGTAPIRLSSGRTVVLELPILQAEEALELIAILPSAIGQMNLQLLRLQGDVAGHVSLPNGQTLPVLTDQQPA